MDQLLHSLDHNGWWSVFGSLRARQNNRRGAVAHAPEPLRGSPLPQAASADSPTSNSPTPVWLVDQYVGAETDRLRRPSLVGANRSGRGIGYDPFSREGGAKWRREQNGLFRG